MVDGGHVVAKGGGNPAHGHGEEQRAKCKEPVCVCVCVNGCVGARVYGYACVCLCVCAWRSNVHEENHHVGDRGHVVAEGGDNPAHGHGEEQRVPDVKDLCVCVGCVSGFECVCECVSVYVCVRAWARTGGEGDGGGGGGGGGPRGFCFFEKGWLGG